jgi:hypothetical protein
MEKDCRNHIFLIGILICLVLILFFTALNERKKAIEAKNILINNNTELMNLLENLKKGEYNSVDTDIEGNKNNSDLPELKLWFDFEDLKKENKNKVKKKSGCEMIPYISETNGPVYVMRGEKCIENLKLLGIAIQEVMSDSK